MVLAISDIKTHGWCQGSFFLLEDHPKLELELQEHERVVVITQDCDLVHEAATEQQSYENEPHVEVLVLTSVPGERFISGGVNCPCAGSHLPTGLPI